ncbi:MAG TPA: DUF6206 family protein [Solirubrobacteraceae bacterium]|nr:DUF6206 family protein [Solirubrobacteraceae bacterium]
MRTTAGRRTLAATAMGATTAPDLALDLERLDRAVEAAIAAGDPRGLRVLGYGEITLVLGWPTEAPELAVKRLPPFAGADAAERYAALLRDYVSALRARGVGVVETGVRIAPGAAGTARAYLVQRLVPRRRLLNETLRAGPEHEHAVALLDRLAAAATAIDGVVGLDAQASNWVVQDDGGLACLDLSTPMLRDAAGRDRLDLDVFLSIYPWALRGALRRVARGLLGDFHDPRTVLLDAASNLHKERLDRFVPPLLASANARLPAAPIAHEEVARYFTRDRRLWLLMQRLRRADRAWQRRVRRRDYPFLLPPPYAYGPPELPEEAPR